MAVGKKSKASPSKTRSPSSQLKIKKVKGENFYRDAKSASRVNLLKGGKPIRDRQGKIIKAAAFQKGEDEVTPGRIQPDRRWFGNTRVISQTALEHFRTSLNAKKDDPYSVLLRRNKLPMALVDAAANPHTQKRPHIVETEPFGDTFGPKAQRKKPRLNVGTFEELSKASAEACEEADVKAEGTADSVDQTHADRIEPIFSKGTSRRIYGELYKVIDSSDVVLHILDARDPFGTMCESVLEFIRKEKPHKQVVLIINKCDLVPNWVTARYIQHLTPRYPTLAFHASPNHSFGKGSLIQLLRQFSQLHSDKKQISVGFIGYPNVGKSSVINTLKSGKVCSVAPVPGETKIWQYITLTRRIYLIDCPGIVPNSANDTQTAKVLKGVLRIEALPLPSEHLPALMARVKPLYLSRTYGIPLPNPDEPSQQYDPEDFMDAMARARGRLLKGGEPDREGIAKIVLSDWVRGRIPYFSPPPERPEELNETRTPAKGKAKEVWKPNVVQKLGGIIQKNSFVGEDVKPLEDQPDNESDNKEPAEDGSESDGQGSRAKGEAPESESGDSEAESEKEEPFEELKWNDVFFGTGGELDKAENGANDNPDDPPSSDEDTKPAKGPRMKTNKRKAANFYTTANVKNRNRARAAFLKDAKPNDRPGPQSRRKFK